MVLWRYIALPSAPKPDQELLMYCRLVTIMVTFKVDCLEWNYDPAYLPLVDLKYCALALLLVYFWNL